MRKPPFQAHFVVGGTQKGGTSALARFLEQHPQVCFSKHKETHFFDQPDFPEWATRDELAAQYARKFPKDTVDKVVGEATPVYMYLPGVAERIHRYHPGMKWVLLLRHPVERAISHYSMERARGWERLPLTWALRVEAVRRWFDRGWMSWRTSLRHHSYLDRGRYAAQVERLWRLFGREQVLVLTSDELRVDHAGTLRKVYAFFGIDEPPTLPEPESVFVTEKKVEVDPKARAWMLQRMEPEVERLEKLLGRTLTVWRI